MCGFSALVSDQGGVDRDVLLAMRDSMVHRGPDECGDWIEEKRRVGLGHRRLSIIDLAHGHQPMQLGDAAVIAYNGELYNHISLRRELEECGRRFSTHCDTEVVLAAYDQWGAACLERFDGMFALVVWDKRREELFFARDRVGKKPLYYVRVPDGYGFASEIKGLLEHPDVRREVDSGALAHYLSFLATPAPQTLFRGILKVPAGHCGAWSPRDGLKVWRWWRPPEPEPLDITETEAEDEVLRLLSAAVGKRMMSDVPFGVYLSGGVDSSANVALMSELAPDRVRTFSIAWEDEPSLDELAHARRVATQFGTQHNEYRISDADVIASLPAMVHAQDEPIGDPVCVPLLHLAQRTKQAGVTVVQIGEGSDEIFMGYGGYTRALSGAQPLWRAESLRLSPLLATAARLSAPLLRSQRGERIVHAATRGVPSGHGVVAFTETTKRALLRSNGYVSAYDYLSASSGSAHSLDEFARVTLRHELGMRLPELLLMRVDKMTMSASVEARAPFLDRDLIDFATKLPVDLRWRGGVGKWVLKRALRHHLPEDLLFRKKQGFGAPVWRWASSLRAIAQQEFFREPILELLRPEPLRDLLEGPAAARHGFEIWALLNFALWHRHWIEGHDLREAWTYS